MTPKTNLKIKLIFPAAIILAFFALVGSASAATYYVDAANGNDSWTGTVGAFTSGSTGPWKTISQVNNFSFQTGDDVYFKEANIYIAHQALNIDWAGTETDRVIVGAYSLSGGLPILGYQATRPIISGSVRTLPSQESMVQTIFGNSYITIRDLEISEARDIGIRLRAAHSRLENCFIHDSGNIGVNPYITNNIELLGNDIYNNNRVVVTGGGVSCRQVKNLIIRNNTIRHNYGSEHLGVFDGSEQVIIDQNKIYDGRMVYIDNARYVYLTRNLIYQTSNSIYRGGSGGWGPYYSIVATAEDFSGYWWPGYMTHFYMWGNLVHGGQQLLNMSSYVYDSSNPQTAWSNSHIYNNTFIEPWSSTGSVSISMPHVSSNVNFKNNIIWKSSANLAILANVAPGVTRSHNAWSGATGSVDPDIRGSGDIYSFGGVAKTTNWTHSQIVPGGLAGDEFKLPLGSLAINSGCPLDAAYNTDYFGTARPQGAGWDIGAHEYAAGGGDTTSPVAPIGLAVR